MTYAERLKIVDDYAKAIKKKYPQINRYNILIFGSFLTERYSENSDIDIGVFSLESGLTFRLYNFTKDYFEQLEIDIDVIRMHLSDSQYLNISIILSQQYAVTDYCPAELISYTKRMLEQYGTNPQAAIVRELRQEAAL